MKTTILALSLAVVVTGLLVYALTHDNDPELVSETPVHREHEHAEIIPDAQHASAAGDERDEAGGHGAASRHVRAGMSRGDDEDGPQTALFRAAQLHLDRGEWSAAIDALDEVLAVAPEHVPAWNDLAAALLERGGHSDIERAAAAARRARDLAPDDWRGPYNLACATARSGDPDTAIASLKAAIARSAEACATARDDPDLDGIRQRPEFARILSACDGG